MDGVLVHENTALPGAQELIEQWTNTGTPFLVLTNNSIFTPRDLAARLRASGLSVPEEAIWTSALATADFCAQQMPDAQKRHRAHFLVDTGHGISHAERSVAAILRALAALG